MNKLFTLLAALSIYTAASAQNITPVVTTFDFTGSIQTYIVPPNVFSIDVDVIGAQGGSVSNLSHEPFSASGGKGGRVQATIMVKPGDVLTIYVGGSGMSDGLKLTKQESQGGFNGGGIGQGGFNEYSYNAGGGGGASDIRLNGTSLMDRIIVAGGGGGASTEGCIGGGLSGGNGGGLIAQDGPNCTCYLNSQNGKGGTQDAGGTPGKWAEGCTHAEQGSLGFGGKGNDDDMCSGGVTHGNGGGGGGGYYGGGGGNDGPGGGGSSFSGSIASNVIHTQGYQKGDGKVVISYSKLSVPIVNIIVKDTTHTIVKDTTHNILVKDTIHQVLKDTSHVVVNNEVGSINIYPNPFVDNFSVYVKVSTYKGMIIVTNMFGEKVYQTELRQLKTDINLAQFPSGAYFVKIQVQGGATIMKKVIKK